MSKAEPDLRIPQFGAILLRAAEMVGDQGGDALDRLGIDFDARKTSIVLMIHRYGPISSTALAKRIGHSRQLIEARLRSLTGNGFLTEFRDPEDARKRLYDFAESARGVADRIVAVMRDFEGVYETLWKEIGVDLEQALLAMEAALAKKPLIDRLIEHHPGQAEDRVEADAV
jgi:DNA-binding MarR family transcriptional regulator